MGTNCQANPAPLLSVINEIEIHALSANNVQLNPSGNKSQVRE